MLRQQLGLGPHPHRRAHTCQGLEKPSSRCLKQGGLSDRPVCPLCMALRLRGELESPGSCGSHSHCPTRCWQRSHCMPSPHYWWWFVEAATKAWEVEGREEVVDQPLGLCMGLKWTSHFGWQSARQALGAVYDRTVPLFIIITAKCLQELVKKMAIY